MDNEHLDEKIFIIKLNDLGMSGGWRPDYTTNIKDAWTLVEEMTEHMDEISLSVFVRLADLKKMWTFEAESYTTEESYCNIDESAPLAIAKCYYEWRTHDRTS